MGNSNPWHDQVPSIVGDEVTVFESLFGCPTNVIVTTIEMLNGRAPSDTGNRPPLCPDHILEVLAYWAGVAQVVISLNEAVKYGFVLSSPDSIDIQWAKIFQAHFNRRAVKVLDSNRLGTILTTHLYSCLGQSNVTRSMQG